jgi:hypothetical protein
MHPFHLLICSFSYLLIDTISEFSIRFFSVYQLNEGLMKRKKITLLVISFTLVAMQVSAQFILGPKVGLNISNVYYPDVSSTPLFSDAVEFRKGLNAGVFGNYCLSDRFDVQAELLYSQQGYKDNIPLTDVNGTTIVNGYTTLTHYLNIPVLIKFYPLKRIYLEAGPQAGFRLGSNYSTLEKEWDDLLNGLESGRKTDFSLVGGLGIYLGKGFSVNARYCHGLLKESNFAYKNRVIQFSVAYDLWQF